MFQVKRPLIFCAFANDSSNYLPEIDAEANEINELFKNHPTYDVKIVRDTRPEILFNLIFEKEISERMVAFHFGGHAGPDQIELLLESGKSKALNNQPFGELLADQSIFPCLKLVFLNGCLTQDQLIYFSNGFIDHIGTTRKVNDLQAKELAIRFYKQICEDRNICKAFAVAKGYAKSLRQKREIKIYSRSLFWDQIDEIKKEEMPWMLVQSEESEKEGSYLWLSSGLYPKHNFDEKYIPVARSVRLDNEKENIFLQNEFEQVVLEKKRIVLFGDPGIGKSAELKALRARLQQNHHYPIVYHDSLKNDIDTIKKTVEEILSLLDKVKTAKVAIILDSLDETGDRADLYRYLGTKSKDYHLSEYPNFLLILSIRNNVFYDFKTWASEWAFSSATLKPLDVYDVDQILELILKDKKGEFLGAVHKANFVDLKFNPFYLLQMATVYKKELSLPSTRFELLDKLVSLAFSKDRKKTQELDAKDQVQINTDLAEWAGLQSVMGVSEISRRELDEAFPGKDVSTYFTELSLVDKFGTSDAKFSFSHSIFQEFYSAKWLAGLPFWKVKCLIRPSNSFRRFYRKWLNVLSFYIEICEDDPRKPFTEWLINQDPSIIKYIDINSLSQEIRKTWFHSLYPNSLRQGSRYQIDVSVLAKLGALEEVVDYLVPITSSINETAQFRGTIGILAEMDLPSKRPEIIECFHVLLDSSELSIKKRNMICRVLARNKYTEKEVLEKLVSLGLATDKECKKYFYRLVFDGKHGSSYIESLYQGIKLVNENGEKWILERAFSTVDSFPLIKEMFSKFNESHFIGPNNSIEWGILINNLAKEYENIPEEVWSWVIGMVLGDPSQPHISEELIIFFMQTSTEEKAIKEILERGSDYHIHKLITPLLNETNIGLLIDNINGGKVDQVHIQLLMQELKRSDLTDLISTIKEHVPEENRINYTAIDNKKRGLDKMKEDLIHLASPRLFISEVKRFLSHFDTVNLSLDKVEDLQTKRVKEFNSRDIVGEFVKKRYLNFDKNEIIGEVANLDREYWNWLLLKTAKRHLKLCRNLELSDQVVTQIDYALKENLEFLNNCSERGLRVSEFCLFFNNRLNIEVTEEVWLSLLRYPVHNWIKQYRREANGIIDSLLDRRNDVDIVVDFLHDKVSFQKMQERLITYFINEDYCNQSTLEFYLDFITYYNIAEAIPPVEKQLMERTIADPEYSRSFILLLIETLGSLEGAAATQALERYLPAADRNNAFYWKSVDHLVNRKSTMIAQYLLIEIDDPSKSERKLDNIKRLMWLGNQDGLKLFVNYLQREKRFQTAQHHNGKWLFESFKDIRHLDAPFDLLELCTRYKNVESFNEGILFKEVLDWLIQIAQEHPKEVLRKMRWYRIRQQMSFWENTKLNDEQVKHTIAEIHEIRFAKSERIALTAAVKIVDEISKPGPNILSRLMCAIGFNRIIR